MTMERRKPTSVLSGRVGKPMLMQVEVGGNHERNSMIKEEKDVDARRGERTKKVQNMTGGQKLQSRSSIGYVRITTREM
jgi:hypothetical protein